MLRSAMVKTIAAMGTELVALYPAANVPGRENGAGREHRYDVLMGQIAKKGLTSKGMEFFLESFKLGLRLTAA